MSGPKAGEDYGSRLDAAEEHGREAMRADKVAIKTMPAAGTEKMKSLLMPLVQEAVSAQDKAGKSGTAFLDDYRK